MGNAPVAGLLRGAQKALHLVVRHAQSQLETGGQRGIVGNESGNGPAPRRAWQHRQSPMGGELSGTAHPWRATGVVSNPSLENRIRHRERRIPILEVPDQPVDHHDILIELLTPSLEH
jgi:hypothetical protein